MGDFLLFFIFFLIYSTYCNSGLLCGRETLTPMGVEAVNILNKQ